MTDLDDALRDMMRLRAQDITAVPQAFAAQTGRVRDRRRVLLPAAAAAAVLLVVGIAVVLSHRVHDKSPATRSSTCPMPAQWRSALDAAPLTVLSAPARPLAALRDGTVFAAANGTIVRVDPHGAQRTELATGTAVVSTSTDGTAIAFVYTQPGHATSEAFIDDPASHSSGTFGLLGITERSYLQDGHLYYSVAGTSSAAGTIHDYVPADLNRADRVVYRGDVRAFRQVPGDYLSWPGRELVTGVPSAVRRVLDKLHSEHVTTSFSAGQFAWHDGRGFWRMTAAGRVSGPFPVVGLAQVTVRAVAGSYVLFSSSKTADRAVYVLDTTTGAIGQTGLVGTGTILAGGTVFVVPTSQGLQRVDTVGLPHISC